MVFDVSEEQARQEEWVKVVKEYTVERKIMGRDEKYFILGSEETLGW
jgi:hypothetical protein